MKHESIVKAKENFIRQSHKRHYNLTVGFYNRFAVAGLFLECLRDEGYSSVDVVSFYKLIPPTPLSQAEYEAVPNLLGLEGVMSNSTQPYYMNCYDIYINILDDMIRVSKMGAFL